MTRRIRKLRFTFSISILVIFVTLFCAAVSYAQHRRSVSGAEVTGTFRQKGGNEFKILALGKNKLRIGFSGIYVYKYDGLPIANLGEAYGIAVITGDTAVFKPEATEGCTITIKFLANRTIDVAQEGYDRICGFGRNVYSSGTYRKISSKKPKFKQ